MYALSSTAAARRLLSGISVCVCEPHAVWIMSMNFGLSGVGDVETRTPS